MVARWPHWFDMEGDLRRTSMGFGFQHRDGWFDLLWRLCESLEPIIVEAERETNSPFEVLEVKAKFGGLRFHANYDREDVIAVVETACLESLMTCEVCGSRGQQVAGNGWIMTLCNEHTRDAYARSARKTPAP